MANKTLGQILYDLSRFVRHHERTGLGGEGINSFEASRQLYEAELERIGEDEREPTSSGGASYARCRNAFRAELRAKARAFYGITETEEGTE